MFSIYFYTYCYTLSFEDYEQVYCIVLYTQVLQDESCKTFVGFFNVSSPAAGIKPDNLAPEASMCTNH